MAGMQRRARAVAGLAGAAGAALAVRAAWVEPRGLRVVERTLALPHWPAALDGLRVAVIGDLHVGALHMDRARVEAVVARCNRAAPDLVALVGDFVTHDPAIGHGGDAADATAPFGALGAPLGAYAVLGNHDWAQDPRGVASGLRRAGVRVLHNDATRVETRGVGLWVTGVADDFRGHADADAALASVEDSEPVLAVTHSPDVFARISPRVSLTIAGHTHGGQVDLPFLRRWAIGSRFGDRYARGHVEEGGRHLFVTPGIGTARLPIRLRTMPEVSLLRLVSAGGGPAIL